MNEAQSLIKFFLNLKLDFLLKSSNIKGTCLVLTRGTKFSNQIKSLWHSHNMLVLRKSTKEVTVTLIRHSNDFKHKICSWAKWGKKLYYLCFPKLQLIGLGPVWLLPHKHWMEQRQILTGMERIVWNIFDYKTLFNKIYFKKLNRILFYFFSLKM